MIFRNGVEIKKINDEFAKINTLIGEVKNPSADSSLISVSLAELEKSLANVANYLDRIDKVWVNKSKFAQVKTDLEVLVNAYNQAKISVVTRSITDSSFVLPSFDAADDKFLPVEVNVAAKTNYLNNPNNLRKNDRIHGIVTRSVVAALITASLIATPLIVAKSNDKVSQIASAYDQLQKDRDQLQLDYNLACIERDDLKKQLENASPEKVAELEEKLKDAENRVAELERQLKDKSDEYEKLKQDYEALKLENESLTNDNSAKAQEITRLEKEIEEKQNIIIGLEASKQVLNDKIAQLQKDLEIAQAGGNKALVDELYKQLREAKSNYNLLLDAYNQKVDEYNALYNDYVKVSDELKAEKEKNKFLEENLDRANSELKRLVDAVDTVYKACYADEGKDIDSLTKLDKIISYYKIEYKDATALKDFLAAFISNVEGVSYDSVYNMSVADIIEEAEKIVDMLQEASKDPSDGNVREDETKKPAESGEVKDPEPVTPDIPVRE